MPMPGRVNGFARGGPHHLATSLTRARADFDLPVGGGDDALVVLDDDHGVAGVDETLQLRHQLVDVGGMKARGRLVEDVERTAPLLLLKLGGELDPLRLAARKLRRGLAEAKVSEADVAQQRERLQHRRLLGEELARGLDGEAQDPDALAGCLQALEIGLGELLQADRQAAPGDGLLDDVRMPDELIADRRADKVASIRIEALLHEQIDLAEVHDPEVGSKAARFPFACGMPRRWLHCGPWPLCRCRCRLLPAA